VNPELKTDSQTRFKAQVREGVVISDKMQKTIVVEVTRLVQHPQFKKIIRTKVKYAAHDEKNQAKVGNKVQIVQSRPLSKTKRWRLVRVLSS
jgi:small subunit ribosomal protein S17